jgi:hypothetical protein
MYREASLQTKPIYEKGHDTEGLNEENWIIRWMLCRYSGQTIDSVELKNVRRACISIPRQPQ